MATPANQIPQATPAPDANTVQPKPALAEHSSANFAPVNPLLALQRGNPKVSSTLQDALKERFRHLMDTEKRVWNEMYAAGYMVGNFIEGRQFAQPNPFIPGTFLPYTPSASSADTRRTLNLTRFYSTNCLVKWQSSNPNIIATMGIDTESAREAAQAADIIVEHYERKFFGPSLTIQEGMQGLCWGTYIWQIRYDDSQHSVTALKPIFGQQPVTLPGQGMCPNCGFSGPSTAFPNPDGPLSPCPRCGETALVENITGMVPGIVGQQEVPLGDLTATLLPFPECRWDIRHRVEHSSWFIHQRRTSMTAIRRLLGNVRLPAPTGSAGDFGLDIAEKLAWSGGSGGGRASIDDHKRRLYEEPVTIGEMSLSADDIADIYLGAPVETLSGQTIPAGRLVDTFPGGLTAQYLNEVGVLTGIFAEHHRSTHVSGVWHSKAMSGTGQGLSDVVEVQKRFNADDSQVHNFLRATGTPGILYRQEAIGEMNRDEYMGDPEINIPINGQNLPEGMRLSDIAGPVFQPQSVPAQLFSYTYERLNDFAQLTSHVTDFSGGLPGVNNDTATGAQISQSNSNALFTPPLQIKGEVRKRIAEIVVQLYRIHFPVARYFPLKGRYGRQQGRYLSAANLSTDIAFDVVKDSELPRNNFTKRQDAMAFFQMVGMGEGYERMQQTNPELTVELERLFNLELNSDTFNQIASLCQQRIQQIKSAAQSVPNPTVLVGVQPDPDTGELIPTGQGAITPPISARELGNGLKAKWLADWLDMDEGQTADMVVRTAVELLITYHFQLEGQQSAAMSYQAGATQAAGAAPTAIGQHLLGKDAATHQASLQPPEPPAAEPPPQAKIIESMAYKDVPPTAQSAMLRSVGLPGTGTSAVHSATLAKAKQKATAAKPSTAPKRPTTK